MTAKHLLLISAIIALTALPATATECGVKHTDLTKPFAGQWRSEDGDLYDIAPGKVDHTYRVHSVDGDKIQRQSGHYVAKSDFENPADVVLDCRALTTKERDSIEQEMTSLADVSAVPGSDVDRAYRQSIALLHARLPHPPYKMMAATGYEDRQWLVLLDSRHLLDIWYGPGDFSAELYERAPSQ